MFTWCGGNRVTVRAIIIVWEKVGALEENMLLTVW